MYAKNDKRRLYQLIKMYLSETISASSFCDEFYYCYDRELDHSNLTELEKKIFIELDEVCDRYSQYEEDFKLDSKAFATEEELYQKVKEVRYHLNALFTKIEE